MNKTLTTHVKERQENLQSKQGNLQSKQVRMEQLTEEQQKQVKKMSTARIRQRSIKADFTEVGQEQGCTTPGRRATSGPRRVLMWPATSSKKSDYFIDGTDIKSTMDHKSSTLN